jgi:hypothetical protein
VETLSSFLKPSSPLDWLVIFLSVSLVLAGILLLMVARGRKPFFAFLILALLPLVLGLAITYLESRQVTRGVIAAGSGPGVAFAGWQHALVGTCIGAAGTVAAMLIGLFGLASRKNLKA